jgi:hypothetical protein
LESDILAEAEGALALAVHELSFELNRACAYPN